MYINIFFYFINNTFEKNICLVIVVRFSGKEMLKNVNYFMLR